MFLLILILGFIVAIDIFIFSLFLKSWKKDLAYIHDDCKDIEKNYHRISRQVDTLKDYVRFNLYEKENKHSNLDIFDDAVISSDDEDVDEC